MPAMYSIDGPLEADLGLQQRAAAKRLVDRIAYPGGILGMGGVDTEVAALGCVQTRERMPDRVAVERLAIHARRPNAQRHRVDQPTDALLGPLLVGFAVAVAQQHRLLFDLLFLQEELDENRPLRSQDVRLERLQQIVDGAVGVPAEDMGGVTAQRSDEDDRYVSALRPLLDELRRLEPVEARHLNVEQDEREISGQQVAQRFFARAALHQLVAERIQHRFERDQIARVVVDYQNSSAGHGGTCPIRFAIGPRA